MGFSRKFECQTMIYSQYQVAAVRSERNLAAGGNKGGARLRAFFLVIRLFGSTSGHLGLLHQN